LARGERAFSYPFFKNSFDAMKYCEYSKCNKEANCTLSLGGVKTYYCLKHLKSVKRRLAGI
jgi:hypothetical protein